ncbi:MAG: PKD domain-containing protein [Chitinophagales bacterium]|nr:PKD domain-containing protein [Chitinophagales bacterium]MCB9074931.1 PKD domain-containing protein [Chitinophagales bacterium]HMW94764.1 PKD domain-containing protein [Chitinophagales bacterium]HMZ93251.1 PKD domain-containing protein [Chitinophagales bacterium]HNC63061.1 PKD domain-containing protein [Chitinophagales bacterium]
MFDSLFNKLFLFHTFFFWVLNSYAVCDFQVDKTSVCADEDVTIILDKPYSAYHKVIVSKGTFPLLSDATPNDFYIVPPYSANDNIVKIRFRGKNNIQDYTIQLAESAFPNPGIPCGKRVVVRVNPTPDPQITEEGNFSYCNERNPKEIKILNKSQTKNTNTQYEIDWGDGSPVFVATQFDEVLHTYAVGDYVIKYKVVGNKPNTTCNISEKEYYVKIGGISPRISFLPSTQTSFCAPGYYEIYPDTSVMNRNTPNTNYKFYVNDELIQTYNQNNLPTILNYYFEEGSCGKSSPQCGQSSVSFYLEAYNGSCTPAILNTCVFITDSLKPYITGKDVVCQTMTESFTNGNAKKDKYIAGTQCKDPIYKWSILESNGYTLKNGTSNINFDVQFDSIGTYTILLSLDASSGICQDKADTTFHVSVVEKLVLDFNLPSIICMPNIEGSFVDVPINLEIKEGNPSGIKKITWTIVPDNTAPINVPNYQIISGNTTAQNMLIRFDAWRSYDIILNYETICETGTIVRKVKIASKGAFDTLPIPSICAYPATINPLEYFIWEPKRVNGGDKQAQFNWTFNGGTPSTQQTKSPKVVSYNASGTYPMTLTITNVCGDTSLSPNVILFDNPQPDAGKDTTLCGISNPITLIGTPSGGIWRGIGIIDSVLGIFDPKIVSAGSYTIFYTTHINSECPPTDSLIVTVLPTGISAGPDQSICRINGNQQAVLQLLSNPTFPGGSWAGAGVINSASGLFSPTNLTPGTYAVQYTYTDSVRGCKDVSSKNIVVHPAVSINMQLPNLCTQQTFDFSFVGGNLIDADWDFGDGGNANIPYPNYIYTNAGDYTIRLKAENSNHCSDTFNIPIKVLGEQSHEFLINNATSCNGSDFVISFPPNHDVAQTYKWYYDKDSLISNQKVIPTLNFTKPLVNDTVYTVKLITKYQCSEYSQTLDLKVKANPNANIFLLSDKGCAPFSTQVLNNSTGQIDSVRWFFGNGQTSTIVQPQQTPKYYNPTRADTSYTITLLTYNICASDTAKKEIVVNANEVYTAFTMSKDAGCTPLTVDFTSTVVGANSFIWNFNDTDSSISFDKNPTFTFDKSGIYPVMLIANGSCGSDTIKRNVTVFGIPDANFEIINACVNQNALFQNKSTDANSFTWNFGIPNATSSNSNPTFKYTQDGAYQVQLIARNTFCADTIVQDILVQSTPKAKFSIFNPEVCFSELVQFNNESTNAFNYTWHFGDNEISDATNPQHIFPNPGIFNVYLVAKNTFCADSVRLNNAVRVNPNPTADFNVMIIDNDLRKPVQFTNISTNAAQYVWQFGDGNSSTEKNPNHIFQYNKGYKIVLEAVSDKNCRDTIEKSININPSGTLYMPNVFTPNGTGENAFFKPKGNKLKEYQIQIFSTYGQLVWESTKLADGSPVEAWDGTFKGVPMPQDVYVWKIRAIFDDGTFWDGMLDESSGKKSVIGSLILIR